MENIPGYDNYFVSESGDVYRDKKLLNTCFDTQGYPCIDIYQNKSRKRFRVCALVASAFCDQNPGCIYIHHINGDITDSHSSNLVWTQNRRKTEYVDDESFPIEIDGYFVTKDGRVVNEGSFLVPSYIDNRTKYERVCLYSGNIRKDLFVHRLVAEAYIENPHDYKYVKHISGDITDNTVKNLQWVKTRVAASSRPVKKKSERPLHKSPSEELKEIPSRPGYLISRDGRIYSLKSGKYMKTTNKNGYDVIELRHLGKRINRCVHKLVAETYLERKEGDICVNHKNGKTRDNRVENLEWCTKSHDVKHAHETGLNPGRRRGVLQIQMTYIKGDNNIYDSMAKASKAIGVSTALVCGSCQNKTLIGDGTKKTKSGKVYRCRYASKHSPGVACKISVTEMIESQEIVQEYISIAEAAREHNIDPSSINNCCRGKTKFSTTKEGEKLYWCYADESENKTIEDYEIKEWLNIPGFSRYKISPDGQIYSTFYSRLMFIQDKKDYDTVRLVDDNGDRKTTRVHRLVALAYHENKQKKRVVNHKDGVKKNNKKDNLEWNTDRENITHANEVLGRRKRKEVIRYDLDMNEIDRFSSASEAALEIGVVTSTVTKVCRGEQKACKGYIFRYE